MSAPIYPVLRHRRPDSAVCKDRRGELSTSQFLSDAMALAGRLPRSEYVVNLCADRYRFAVGLVASLLCDQVTLLPMSAVAAPIAELAQDYPALYALQDEKMAPAEIPAYHFPDDLPKLTSNAMPPVPGFRADQPAVVLFTSGSTGRPMPHPRSWGALVVSTAAAARGLGIADLAGANVLGTIPHQHSYGLESIVMLSLQHEFAFHGGRPLLPVNVAERLLELDSPRILITTPIHLRSLLSGDVTLPAMHRIVCATAPLSSELAREAEQRFGAPLFEIYGCTEVGQIAVRRTVETTEWLCIEGIKLEGSGGEVRAIGPAAASDTPLNDIIELLSSERFLLHGRKSDLVNIAGKRTSLAYLNFHLNAIEGVHDGVFVMPADDKRVARLCAYVVAPGLAADDVLAALRRVIDPAFLPRPLHMVEVIPRNPLGKLPIQDLAQMHDNGAER